MKQIRGRPPLFDEIVRVFPHAAGKRVVFAWGDEIYVPDGSRLPPQVVAHEEAHGARQVAMGVERWWQEYLASPTFRLEEEIVGHRAEYRDLLQQSADRNRRNAYLQHVAAKLASPLYGGMITQREAVRCLQSG